MSSSESDSEHLSFDHVPRDSTQNLSSFSYVEVDNSSSEETGDAEMSSISIRSTTSWGSSNVCLKTFCKLQLLLLLYVLLKYRVMSMCC